MKNSRKEIEPLLQHKVFKDRISELISFMLKEEFDERIDLVNIIKHPYFSEFIRENPELCMRVYPDLSRAIQKSINNLPSLEKADGSVRNMASFRSIGSKNPHMDHTEINQRMDSPRECSYRVDTQTVTRN